MSLKSLKIVIYLKQMYAMPFMHDIVTRLKSAAAMISIVLGSMSIGLFDVVKVLTVGLAFTELYNFANVSALKRPSGHASCGHISWLLNFVSIVLPIVLLHKSLQLDNSEMFYLFSVVWSADCGGLVIGRFLGDSGSLTEWSPRKTLHGFYGAILFGTFFGYLYSGLIYKSFQLAIVSQLGDFLESVVKRHCGLKDSNYFIEIPGHGGILDRIDGLIFAILVF